MLVVALTGGIGSGKSTVGQIFAQLGAIVIDSDQLARDVIERGSIGFNEVVTKFGDEILKNGEIDRQILASLVFKDPTKRAELEQITHPLIRKAFAKVVSSASPDSIVINQIPLLVESNHDYKFDHIITVSASESIRNERLIKRGLTNEQIKQRIQAQATDQMREDIADSVIVNEKSEQEITDQVEKIWEQLLSKNVGK
ncbi:MAG: dephospho-CoA kinase [Actinobacteria bacterium]|nr:dephospho-CoA kinase [Actinomycetota bacterium]